MSSYDLELDIAVSAANEAASAILRLYKTAAVHIKGDGSPVTEADLASDRIIRRILTEHFPDDAILTEESSDDGRRFAAPRCWIVDPIDGTASFVEKTGDFDVYIALVVDHLPVVAVSLQPVTGTLLTAVAGSGATITTVDGHSRPLRLAPARGGLKIGTRNWLGAPRNLPWLSAIAAELGDGAVAVEAQDGLGARTLVDSEREVDAIFGYSPNGSPLDGYEWDIAVVDLIVREAGGASSDLNDGPLRFNQPNPILTSVLITPDPNTHARILTAIRAIGR